jgi:hypothetical protein
VGPEEGTGEITNAHQILDKKSDGERRLGRLVIHGMLILKLNIKGKYVRV